MFKMGVQRGGLQTQLQRVAVKVPAFVCAVTLMSLISPLGPKALAATPGTWTPTGSLAQARYGATVTSLPNGKVLVAGGFDGTQPIASAEIFNPASGTWSSAGTMSVPRFFASATLLNTGKVLVAGGFEGSGVNGATAELYDPATNGWSTTGGMAQPRYAHTSTLLPDGRVLVVGGYNSPSVAGAELYNPATGSWSGTGSLNVSREFHSATLLPSGKVLVAGGKTGFETGGPISLPSAELWDPATGSWSFTASMAGDRFGHTASMLASGKVLVAGGASTSTPQVLATSGSEIYDPAAGSWSATGNMTAARFFQSAVTLAGGQVLEVGGLRSMAGPVLFSVEAYDTAAGTWTAVAALNQAREFSSTTVLADGRVLAAAGTNGGNTGVLASAEIFAPTAPTMSGRAYAASVSVTASALSITLPAMPDTGQVSTKSAGTTSTPCVVALAGKVSAGGLCASVTTAVNPSSSVAEASVANATIDTGIAGVPIIVASGLKATSQSSCSGSASGATVVGSLTIGGITNATTASPNTTIPIPGSAGGKLIVNEQIPAPGGLTVNALHLIVPASGSASADVVLASATSGIANCP